MTSQGFWTYIHILLFVFWLGADIGVYVAAIYAKNEKLGFEARATLMKLGGFVDLFPRITFAFMLPVGLHLTAGLGLYPVSGGLLAGGWLIALGWLALIVVMYRSEGRPLAMTLVRVQNVFQGVMGLVFVIIGGQSLLAGTPLAADWFAFKLLLFGLVFWTAMVVEISYRPLFPPFLAIGESGSTPEREALVKKYINRALVGVGTIYVLIATIAFLGTTKPF